MASVPIASKELVGAEYGGASLYPRADGSLSRHAQTDEATTVSGRTAASINAEPEYNDDNDDSKSITGPAAYDEEDDIEKRKPGDDAAKLGPNPTKSGDDATESGEVNEKGEPDLGKVAFVDDYPEGGLRAWSVVLGVSSLQFPSNGSRTQLTIAPSCSLCCWQCQREWYYSK